ncbi:MAG TPA: SDR family NAD(P)-dependent oxidoreductase [Candidatus Binataceae bacterium]|jgi:NAD(P)-dependent dehydrogenase (short-subunit alcohol dehydrogenase family)|nr:SDR family NAD(P)-dependent oxidoreductase [Candidatus Binataceae bacterium]
MILENFSLEGKVAIITGAGRGLGRAMAIRFAACGADIVGAARTVAQLEDTAAEVRKSGRKFLVQPTDVSSSEQVNAMVAAALKEFGRVDVLVNNAGIGEDSFGKKLEEITDAEWRTGIDVNLSSQFYAARAVIPHMVARKRGKIINVASGYGLRGGKHNYMYACSKGAILQLTRSLALTYADDNIQTNCIVPGIFPHNEAMMRFFKGGKFIPIGRAGQDDDVGPLAVFLASEASNHINGELLIIDGGGLVGGIVPTGVAPTNPES